MDNYRERVKDFINDYEFLKPELKAITKDAYNYYVNKLKEMKSNEERIRPR